MKINREHNDTQFSLVTKQYLAVFQKILNNMICRMQSARLSNSISHNFIVQMIPHHSAAIKMSENLLQYTTLIPLQNIALNIISEQTKGIRDMECILHSCSRMNNNYRDLTAFQNQINHIKQIMYCGMTEAVPDNDINISFIREMIPHHKGAVAMSSAALNYPICDGLRPILNSIITTQEEGIRELEDLLSQLLPACQETADYETSVSI